MLELTLKVKYKHMSGTSLIQGQCCGRASRLGDRG
jgi:hypothetical protein